MSGPLLSSEKEEQKQTAVQKSTIEEEHVPWVCYTCFCGRSSPRRRAFSGAFKAKDHDVFDVRWQGFCSPSVARFAATDEQPHTDETEWREQTMSTAGLSGARLARMHDVMTGYVERGEVPGLVTLVSRRGEVHVDAIGTQAFADPTPVRRDTIFRISSMTKPITAAATISLVEECKLRLDEPVDRWLPELAERQVLKRLDGPLDDTVPANRPITVRDLLTFRMGFGQMMALPITSPLERVAYPILQAANEQQIGMGPPSPSSWACCLRAPQVRSLRHSCANASSSRSKCATPVSACRRHRSTGWQPATGPTPRAGSLRCMTRTGAANGATHLPSRRELGGWFPPSTTIWPLVR